MRKTFEVADDFYRTPTYYREEGLKRVAAPRRSRKSSIYDESDAYDLPGDAEANSNILLMLGWDPRSSLHVVCRYYVFRGEDSHCSLGRRLQGYGWAALICLSLTKGSSASIGFCRLAQSPPPAPATEDRLDDAGHPFGDRLLLDGTPLGHSETCRVTLYQPMRFNRMVLFQPSALGPIVTPDSESGLLVQTLAFSESS